MTAMDANLMHWIGELAAEPSRMAAGAFVAGLWQGLALAAGAWLCLRVAPKTSAAVRFAVWTAVFAVLAVLPLLHMHSGRAEQTLAAHGAMFHVDARWSFAIAGVWAALSLLRAGRLIAGGLKLRAIWKRATPVAPDALPLAVDGLRGAELCISRDVDRPSVIGFFSPRILVPEELFEALTTPELEQIVLHELGHLRRRDDWMNLAQKIGLVLFPLNPALVWIERRLCFERELACDDDVLRMTRAPKAYARCLTNLAEHRMERRAAGLSLGAWERRSELGHRVHSILRGGPGMGRVQSRVVLGVMAMALLGGATELARCPRLVSFAAPSSPSLAEPLVQPAMYRPVVATMPASASAATHETLLKATMPVAAPTVASTVVPAVHRQRTRSPRPALQQVKKIQPAHPRVEQWVVMTSWSSSGPDGATKVSKMVFSVPDERGARPAYAAVPTFDGWLLLQL